MGSACTKTLPPTDMNSFLREKSTQWSLIDRDVSNNSKLQVRVSCVSIPGTLDDQKPHSQDSFRLVDMFHGDEKNSFMATVFDGHGIEGTEVAEFLSEHAADLMWDQKSKVGDWQIAAIRGLQDAHQALIDSGIGVRYSGSTCCGVAIEERDLVSFNIGDSRALLLRDIGKKGFEPYPLTKEHRPELPQEKKRITNAGGEVRQRSKDTDGPMRCFLRKRSIPGLAMSRSLGDSVAHEIGVIPVAEVVYRQLRSRDRFIIVATDGLWDVMSNDDVCALLTRDAALVRDRKKEPTPHALVLGEEAHRRWQAKVAADPSVLVDDCTIIVIETRPPSDQPIQSLSAPNSPRGLASQVSPRPTGFFSGVTSNVSA